nr:putative late blight resistance protein homolog R1B-14 [Ipomoea batatas]GMD43636.1 putative late blight resistance protein homolog R1B-14 [Ipomoea batatas]
MGHEIVAWKLICLWIAEGFFPIGDEEVEALNYLNILVNRNLVMVTKRSADGQIKTCCIHDTLHEFCRTEAERINLFHVMDEGQRLNARINLRRLCSYYTMNIFDHVENSNPSDSFSVLFDKRMGPHEDGEYVKSLLLSSSQKREIYSKPEQLKTILTTFNYLQVLNIESLKFSSLPNELYSKVSRSIRYLAITADITSLPKSFEHLSRLETLVIKTTERALQINGGIWNMKKLRHVHTNTSTQLPSPPKYGPNQTDIRTLSTISPGSCTNEIFNMTSKLQKLGVRGNLSELILEKKQNVCLFDNLQMLECLKNLKLHGNSEKVELKVPMLDKFPRRLRKLTLSGTLFQWNDMMTVFGLLEKLKVLKFDDNAFSGERWDLSSDVIFKGLQYLRIGKMNLITWTTVDSKKSFPVLESLVLRNCTSLQTIPLDFANVDSLKVMELFNVSETVSDFARKICAKRNGKTNVKINGFNLFITDPLPSQATVSL